MKSLLLLVALVAATVAAAHAQNAAPTQVVIVPGTAPLPRAPTHFVKATIVDEAELAKYDPTPKAAPTPTPVPVQPAEPASVQPTAEGHYPLNMTALQEKEAWNQDQAQHERVKELVEQALTPDTEAAALPVDPPAESEFDYTSDGLPAEPTPAEQIDWTQEGTPLAVNPDQQADYVPQEVDYVDEEVDFVPESESTPVEAVADATVRVPETVHDNIPPPGVVAEESAPAPQPEPASAPKMETESDNVPPPGLFSEGEGDASATVQPETSFDQNAIAAAEKIAEQAGSVSANATANVYSDDLARIQVAAAPGAAVQRFLTAVRSKIGRPYARGAAGPNAFDCSGLVVWAARQAGLTTLPRTADQLSKVGRAISSTSQRLPGDLIFFGKPGQKVYHVGVYVGPNQMIDAPHTGAFVRQENYSYWPDKLTVARRIF